MKIRIAVAVDETGEWNCSGWKGATDEEMLGIAADVIGGDQTKCYIITAEIDPPKVSEIQGTVEELDIQKRDWQNRIYKQCDEEDNLKES
jgi:hypothetical protein